MACEGGKALELPEIIYIAQFKSIKIRKKIENIPLKGIAIDFPLMTEDNSFIQRNIIPYYGTKGGMCLIKLVF